MPSTSSVAWRLQQRSSIEVQFYMQPKWALRHQTLHAETYSWTTTVLPVNVSNEFDFFQQRKRTAMPSFDSTRADGERPRFQGQAGGGQRLKKCHNDPSRHSLPQIHGRPTYGNYRGSVHDHPCSALTNFGIYTNFYASCAVHGK